MGNARTFLINAWAAQAAGWCVVLRVDDLDGPRVKAGATDAAVADLAWLGVAWDLGPVRESGVDDAYAAALRALQAAGLVYPCAATRRDIEAASAPNEGEYHDVRYPGLYHPDADPPAVDLAASGTYGWRLRLDRLLGVNTLFDDGFRGRQVVDVAADVGDFIVWTKQGVPAYQLACVVDDLSEPVDDAGVAWPRVSEVVRGDDLLASTGRQILVHAALRLAGFGVGDLPRWWHVPLVRGPDGRRLAKRHGDTRLSTLRAEGVPPERIIGLSAWWCGLTDRPTPLSFDEAAGTWSWRKLPGSDVVFGPAELDWLQGGAWRS